MLFQFALALHLVGAGTQGYAAPVSLRRFFNLDAPACADYLTRARPRINLERVILRRAGVGDQAEATAILSDLDLARRYLANLSLTEAEARDYFADALLPGFKLMSTYRLGRVLKLRFVIAPKDSPGLVGFGLIERVVGRPGTWGVGYAIRREYQRRGLATEVARGLVETITALDARAVIVTTPLVSNYQSHAVLARVGFVEGERVWEDRSRWTWRAPARD